MIKKSLPRQLLKYLLPVLLTSLPLAGLQAQMAGDVITDGRVDIVDALAIAQYAVGMPAKRFNALYADVDNSGIINIVDALIVAQYSVGSIARLPIGAATPAPTPTPDPEIRITYYYELVDRTAAELGPDTAYIYIYSYQQETTNYDPVTYYNEWVQLPFTLSGIAENGVDYESLPGEVWIALGRPPDPAPEGVTPGYVTIIPVLDYLEEGNETLIIDFGNVKYTIEIKDAGHAPEPVEIITFTDPDV